MTRQRILRLAATIVLSFATGALLHAQSPGAEGTVSGTGVEIIKRKPEILRMQIEISAKGKTLAEALKKLDSHREAAMAQLAKMSSEQEGTRAGDAQISTSTNPQQRQIEMMVRQRMRQASKKSKKSPEKSITVACTLTTQWKLKGKTAEELLLEAQAIEDKVQAADLAGKDSEEKTAEEEELAEEMEQQMANFGDDSQSKPGEPVFMFVSKISRDERAKAMAAAFAKARQQAEELSVAAGSELGALQGLSRQASLNNFNYGMNARFSGPRNARLFQLMAERGQQDEDDDSEAVGAQASEVALPINVTASFVLKPAK